MISNLKLSNNKTVLKIVFFIIIISFIVTGTVGYIVVGSKNYIIKVNNSLITREQFIQAIKQEKEIFKQEGLENQFYKMINNRSEKNIFYQNILDNLIGIILLNQYSNKLGLLVSDKKIKEEIYSMDLFKKNGVFNQEKYEFFIKKHHINKKNLVKDIRKNLINRQLIKIYLDNEFVLPDEYKTYARFVLEKRKIRTATLPISKYFYQQNVTNQELLEYYRKNKNKFYSPEQVKIDYIKFNLSSQYNNINISNSEIKIFYEKNQEYFKEKEKKHYSMIQLDTKKEADFVISSLNSGEDFRYLAVKKSTDQFSARKKGSIGWFDSSSIPKEIDSANLNKVGQISDLLKLGNHYFVFRLDKIKNENIKSLKLVKDKIISIIKKEKALSSFYLLKKNIKDIITKDKKNSIFQINNMYKKKIISTNWFNKNTLPSEINYNKIIYSIFNDDFMEKENKNISVKLINLDKENFIVFQKKQHKPKTLLSFSESKKKIKNLVKFNKAFLELEKKSNKLIVALQNSKGKDISRKIGIVFSEPFIINRFLSEKKLSNYVFNMPIPKKDNPIYFTVRDNNNNLVIVKLIDVINDPLKNEQLPLFLEYYNNIFSSVILELFISNLREKANINFGKIN